MGVESHVGCYHPYQMVLVSNYLGVFPPFFLVRRVVSLLSLSLCVCVDLVVDISKLSVL